MGPNRTDSEDRKTLKIFRRDFYIVKKSTNHFFHQFGPKFETIFSKILYKTKVFLCGFLGVLMALNGQLGFGTISKEMNYSRFGQILMPIGAMCYVHFSLFVISKFTDLNQNLYVD